MTSRTYRSLVRSSAPSESTGGVLNDRGLAVGMIIRTGQAMSRMLDSLLAQEGMSYSKYSALSLFFHAESSLTLREVAELLAVNPASVTGLIDRMETDGLVKRQNHPTDRRTTLAIITPKGKKVYSRCLHTLMEKEYGLQGVPLEDLHHLGLVLDPIFEVLTHFER